ncbi:cytochrome c oxidase subunit II [Effusibacillus dendaii]|uniref:Cytochrome aa3 subunit 2 n=1 Tax=Effusibacillus dendaii TaxID=2743772 RepID=A0A7I8DC23_9BACL|nr:cytochrome c oxidase subunit II [Effusibacillus dendaii]BCJ86882.1 cytochrome c oxidase subunit II [Effusibacillus dendaii]
MHIHRFEKIWLIIGGAIVVIFIVSLFISTFAMGMQPPSIRETIDPKVVDQTPPFDKPGLKQIGDKRYEADMTAFVFGYGPAQMEVPAGSTVTFRVTSKDVVHGFEIPGTDVNLMAVPGLVNEATQTFNKPGEYLILCNEYCGAGHQLMSAKLIVK